MSQFGSFGYQDEEMGDGPSEDGSAKDEDESSVNSSVAMSDTSCSNLSQKSMRIEIYRLSERVHKKLCVGDSNQLPVKSHRSAIDSMVRLRDLLQRLEADAERDVRLMLLYAGVSVQRRLALGAEGDEACDLRVTLALLFMLQVLCDAHTRNVSPEPTGCTECAERLATNTDWGPCNEGRDDANIREEMPDSAPQPASATARDVMEQWSNVTLKAVIEDARGNAPGSWGETLALTPDSVCRACVAEAPRLGATANLARLGRLAETFFRCSALTLQYNLLQQHNAPDPRRSFLTLSTTDLLETANGDVKEARLAAIVDAAESEAGQQARPLT